MSFSVTDLATRLASARRGSTAFDYEPSLAPSTIAEAFATSTAVAQALGAEIGGWKVGYSPNKTPVAAPMYSAGFRQSGGEWPLVPGVPMLPEVEIAVKLKRDLPPRPGRPYQRDEILDAIGEVFAVFELVESRYSGAAKPSYEAGLADDISHRGFVLGASIGDAHALDLTALRCRLWIDGELVVDRVGGHPNADPLAPLMTWASTQNHPLGTLRAGQIVTTGNLTPGLAWITNPTVLEAELDGIGKVSVTLVAAR